GHPLHDHEPGEEPVVVDMQRVQRGAEPRLDLRIVVRLAGQREPRRRHGAAADASGASCNEQPKTGVVAGAVISPWANPMTSWRPRLSPSWPRAPVMPPEK